jgi:antitoxin (DNA-binding transcriptional repressor) of toxin-antitoxin stability system
VLEIRSRPGLASDSETEGRREPQLVVVIRLPELSRPAIDAARLRLLGGADARLPAEVLPRLELGVGIALATLLPFTLPPAVAELQCNKLSLLVEGFKRGWPAEVPDTGNNKLSELVEGFKRGEPAEVPDTGNNKLSELVEGFRRGGPAEVLDPGNPCSTKLREMGTWTALVTGTFWVYWRTIPSTCTRDTFADNPATSFEFESDDLPNVGKS